jgi:hypothetical protein
MKTCECLIHEFADHFETIEKLVQIGDLATAYQKVDLLKKNVTHEIFNTYGKCKNTQEIRELMNIMEYCDSLRSKTLRAMTQLL